MQGNQEWDSTALTCLSAYEKSLDYAQNLLNQAEILDAKLTLDQIAKNLNPENFQKVRPEIMEKRNLLAKRMEELREDILMIRRRSFRKRSVAQTEISPVHTEDKESL